MHARMRQTCLFTVVALGLVVLLAGTTFAQSSSPTNIGTWKLNVAKSKSSPGPAAKSGTVKYETAGAGVKVTVDSVAADGTVSHSEYTTNYDGKDSPITGATASADVAVVTRIDASTTRRINKKDGKVMNTQTAVVSGDGKTLTITTKGTNAAGQTVNNVGVYEKQ
jgi:hypothetical protein